ncbi:hypothetical protein Bca52824_071059 [Brassica carinata]|uniref:Uncharacterized protein n=1 Tax=Brassica carinata TaxID=52824 RepID=A0A8X7Q895_BRACI|nr:hypothetical protein Bca52824_071059 [Brassica carinata]
MSCIRYGEGGKGMADGGCSVSSIEGVHDSYIVVISGRWIMYDTGDWDFKLDSDRMGRAVYLEVDNFVEDLKRAIIESSRSSWNVDKYINVFVTFKEEIYGKIHFTRPMGNLLKSKEFASNSEIQVGNASADVHTGMKLMARTTNPPSTFEDYVDEGRDYIGSSRISMENIEEASNNLGVKSVISGRRESFRSKSRRGPKFGQQLPNVGSRTPQSRSTCILGKLAAVMISLGRSLNVFRLDRHMISFSSF